MSQTIDITFSSPINFSLTEGDIVFFCPTATDGDFTKATSDPKKIGKVKTIATNEAGDIVVTVNIKNNQASPSATDYFFFSKDVAANYSGLTGYYAEVKMTNNKTTKAELYALGSQFVESSK